jgi:HK97 family phage prohead protease
MTAETREKKAYASLFGVEHVAGDVVRAGAFARTLRRRREVRMLPSCVRDKLAGRWMTMPEDERGLFVRALVSGEMPAGRAALTLIGDGAMDGLSIGFIATDLSARVGQGQGLREFKLSEISLATSPMLRRARFAAPGAFSHKRVAA